MGWFCKTWRNSVFIAVPSHGLHLKVYVHSPRIQTKRRPSSLGNNSGVAPSGQSSVQANWGAFNQFLLLNLEPALATPVAGYDWSTLFKRNTHACLSTPAITFASCTLLMSLPFQKARGILNFALRFNSGWDLSTLGSWIMFQAELIALSAVYE